ncbi:aldo/keto reductase [Microbacterium sp. ZW T5_45]|uniref:aldo/keto reductase n=1 Tax=Microbacterium sp. ZW T5_45 TaxID=3378080 RepID=UPI00385314F1
MQYTRLGRAGAKVSRLALGTMNFGPVIDEAASTAILDRAVEAGVDFIDTADVYGGGMWGDHPGQSEEILGRWMRDRGNRDDLIVATKVYGVMGQGRNDRGLSAVHIRAAVDASLRRLGTDRIDLYQMHHIDREVPLDEVLGAFATLREQGKIVYLGSSNFAGWHIARVQEVAAAAGFPAPVTEQSLYNLAQRTIELEVVPASEQYGVGILPWSPLASGQLGGVLSKTDRSRSSLDALGDRRPAIERYEAFCAELGIRPGVVAIAWLLHQPSVTAPIIGPRTIDQLDSAIEALDVTLDADALAELDRIWPGPGGTAPEAYAW